MKISPKHFGINVLFEGDDKLGHDFVADGITTALVQLYKDFGFRYIRYPGGSITEDYANTDPMSLFDTSHNIPFDEALQTCKQHGFKMHLVIPSKGFQLHPNKMVTFFNKLATYDLSVVETIEVGNEYWGQDLTDKQYGALANSIIPHIEKLKKAKCPKAEIYLQAAPAWKPKDTTLAMHEPISTVNLACLAGSVDHWYPQSHDGTRKWSFFYSLSSIPNRTKQVVTSWKTNVSEWNVSAKVSKEEVHSIYGLDQGLANAQQLWRLANHEVDYASFWGFYYNTLASKLVGIRSNGKVYETAAGTVFKTFQELVNFEPILTQASFEATLLNSTFFNATSGNYTTYFKTGDTELIVSGITILNTTRFGPMDDATTGWLDESLGGSGQQAVLVNEGKTFVFAPNSHYRVKYKPVVVYDAVNTKTESKSFVARVVDTVKGWF